MEAAPHTRNLIGHDHEEAPFVNLFSQEDPVSQGLSTRILVPVACILLVVLVLGLISLAGHTMGPVAFLRRDEQLLLQYPSDKIVINGPATAFFIPFLAKAQRRPALVLEDEWYVTVTDQISGAMTTQLGPKLYFPGAYDSVSEKTRKLVLQSHEYVKLLQKRTGDRRVVTGPRVLVPEPTEEVEKKGTGISLSREQFVRVRNKDGQERIEKGEKLFFPGPEDHVMETRAGFNLKKDEYVRLFNDNGGVRVEKGEQLVFPRPLESCPRGIEAAVHVDDETAVVVSSRTTGSDQWRLVTEKGPFIPGEDDDRIEARQIIKVDPHHVYIITTRDGTKKFISGGDAGVSFFLQPYEQINAMRWSSGTSPDDLQAGRVKNAARPEYLVDVESIDTRWQDAEFKFTVQTSDNVKLNLEGHIFWQVVDVPKMFANTKDPKGDVWKNTRHVLNQVVSKVNLAEFMEAFNNLVKNATAEDMEFYDMRGTRVHRVEVTGYTCSDPLTEKTLQEVNQETTNTINRLKKQESENQVERERMLAQIELEHQRTKLIEVRAENEHKNASIAGQSQGVQLAEQVRTFLATLNDTVPEVERRLALFKLFEDNRAMIENTHRVFVTPEQMKLRLQLPDSDKDGDGPQDAAATINKLKRQKHEIPVQKLADICVAAVTVKSNASHTPLAFALRRWLHGPGAVGTSNLIRKFCKAFVDQASECQLTVACQVGTDLSKSNLCRGPNSYLCSCFWVVQLDVAGRIGAARCSHLKVVEHRSFNQNTRFWLMSMVLTSVHLVCQVLVRPPRDPEPPPRERPARTRAGGPRKPPERGPFVAEPTVTVISPCSCSELLASWAPRPVPQASLSTDEVSAGAAAEALERGELSRWFLGPYLEGTPYAGEQYSPDQVGKLYTFRYDAADGPVHVWRHCLNLRPAVNERQEECIVLYHYTSELGFENVANTNYEDATVFASLVDSRAHFGKGVYVSQYEPSVWGLRVRILLNNYSNGSPLLRDTSSAEPTRVNLEWGDGNQWGHRAAYCIPIIISASRAYNIFKRHTPDFAKRYVEVDGRTRRVRLGQDYKGRQVHRSRDVWVIALDEHLQVENRKTKEVLEQRLKILRMEKGNTDDATLQCMNELGERFFAHGWISAAAQLHIECLVNRQAKFGKDHRDSLLSANSLAEILLQKGWLREATSILREVLATSRTRLPDDPLTLEALSKLATVLSERSLYDEALSLQHEALGMCRTIHGNLHLQTLAMLYNLGLLLHAKGYLDQAAAVATEALQNRQTKLGSDHPDVVLSTNSLASVLLDKGDLSAAKQLLSECVERCTEKFHEQHHLVAMTRCNLVRALLAQDNCLEAVPLAWQLEESLRGYRSGTIGEGAERIPEDLPQRLEAESLFAAALLTTFRCGRASEELDKILPLCRARLGDAHPTTLEALQNRAWAWQVEGVLESGAAPLVREVLQTCRAVFGNDHPKTLSAINHQARLLQDQGRFWESGSLCHESLEACRAILGNTHPTTLDARENMASLLQAQGHMEEAMVMFRELLETCRARLGDDHRNTLRSMNNLAQLFTVQGRLEEAEKLSREALDRRTGQEKTVGDIQLEDMEVNLRFYAGRDRLPQICKFKLAAVLVAQGNFAEALALIGDCYDAPRLELEDLVKQMREMMFQYPQPTEVLEKICQVLEGMKWQHYKLPKAKSGEGWCFWGHSLWPTSGPQNDGFQCMACRRRGGLLHRCLVRRCNFALCGSCCAAPASEPACSNGHKLQPIVSQDRHCKLCLAPGTTYMCLACRYDLCNSCYAKKEASIKEVGQQGAAVDDAATPASRPKCNKGHNLLEILKEFRQCDVCRKIGTAYQCPPCQFDMCTTCYSKRRESGDDACNQKPSKGATPTSSPKCNSGHELEPAVKEFAATCDICRKLGTAYRCPPCNFDMCTTCYSKRQASMEDAGQPEANTPHDDCVMRIQKPHFEFKSSSVVGIMFPRGLAFDSRGRLWVSHFFGELEVWDADYATKLREETLPSLAPAQMCFTPGGELLMTFAGGHERVQMVDPTDFAELDWFAKQVPGIVGVAVFGHQAYVTRPGFSGLLSAFGLAQFDEEELLDIGRKTRDGDQQPSGLAVLEGALMQAPLRSLGLDQLLVIADRKRNRVVLVDPRDSQVHGHIPDRETWKEGGSPGALQKPSDVAVDAEGNILVMDIGNERVAVFRQDGTYVTSILDGFLKDYGDNLNYMACNHETGHLAISMGHEHKIAIVALPSRCSTPCRTPDQPSAASAYIRCTGGHVLLPKVRKKGVCARCTKKRTAYHCHECDESLCATCYQRKLAKAESAPRCFWGNGFEEFDAGGEGCGSRHCDEYATFQCLCDDSSRRDFMCEKCYTKSKDEERQRKEALDKLLCNKGHLMRPISKLRSRRSFGACDRCGSAEASYRCLPCQLNVCGSCYFKPSAKTPAFSPNIRYRHQKHDEREQAAAEAALKTSQPQCSNGHLLVLSIDNLFKHQFENTCRKCLRRAEYSYECRSCAFALCDECFYRIQADMEKEHGQEAHEDYSAPPANAFQDLPRCPKGHSVTYLGASRETNWRCDACKRGIHAFDSQEECEFDLCGRCFLPPDPVEPLCYNGHRMLRWKFRWRYCKGEKCSKSPTVYRCRACDLDLCKTCAGKQCDRGAQKKGAEVPFRRTRRSDAAPTSEGGEGPGLTETSEDTPEPLPSPSMVQALLRPIYDAAAEVALARAAAQAREIQRSCHVHRARVVLMDMRKQVRAAGEVQRSCRVHLSRLQVRDVLLVAKEQERMRTRAIMRLQTLLQLGLVNNWGEDRREPPIMASFNLLVFQLPLNAATKAQRKQVRAAGEVQRSCRVHLSRLQVRDVLLVAKEQERMRTRAIMRLQTLLQLGLVNNWGEDRREPPIMASFNLLVFQLPLNAATKAQRKQVRAAGEVQRSCRVHLSRLQVRDVLLVAKEQERMRTRAIMRLQTLLKGMRARQELRHRRVLARAAAQAREIQRSCHVHRARVVLMDMRKQVRAAGEVQRSCRVHLSRLQVRDVLLVAKEQERMRTRAIMRLQTLLKGMRARQELRHRRVLNDEAEHEAALAAAKAAKQAEHEAALAAAQESGMECYWTAEPERKQKEFTWTHLLVATEDVLDSLETAVQYTSMARTLREKGLLARGIRMMERALAIVERQEMAHPALCLEAAKVRLYYAAYLSEGFRHREALQVIKDAQESLTQLLKWASQTPEDLAVQALGREARSLHAAAIVAQAMAVEYFEEDDLDAPEGPDEAQKETARVAAASLAPAPGCGKQLLYRQAIKAVIYAQTCKRNLKRLLAGSQDTFPPADGYTYMHSEFAPQPSAISSEATEAGGVTRAGREARGGPRSVCWQARGRERPEATSRKKKCEVKAVSKARPAKAMGKDTA
ncbi:Klc2 [Symbiodinium natans]|uniref:Klc2 protein n=1 Tax=Symbiodinium natans TaxID=878477 RepID=A0A812RXG5_9DINO|nr:Klc2 [Symbiodinium natans]